jgi:hypothetical protein
MFIYFKLLYFIQIVKNNKHKFILNYFSVAFFFARKLFPRRAAVTFGVLAHEIAPSWVVTVHSPPSPRRAGAGSDQTLRALACHHVFSSSLPIVAQFA